MLQQALGTTFAGKRNVDEALGYNTKIGTGDYRARYERNGLAKRIIEAYPKATWRGTAEAVEDDDPNVITKFEGAWATLAARLNVWSRFKQADILAGLSRYAVVLIGGPGELKTPLPKVTKPEQIAYLSAFGEDDATIVKFDEKPDSPRYGLPELYAIGRLTPAALSRQTRTNPLDKAEVHWTRVIHVAVDPVDDDVYGQPRLQAVWNRLDDLDKVIGGGSEAFWLRAHQGYVVNMDREMQPPPTADEIEALKTQAEDFAHGLRRTVGARGIDFKAMGSDVANFANQTDAIIALISASTEIPKRILMGSEQGELASTQDRHNWDSRVMARRLDFATAQVVRPFIDRLIQHGALPKPAHYDIWWPEILNLTEDERASVASRYASANQAQVAATGQPILTEDEIRDRILDLPPLAPEQMTEEQEDAAAEADLPLAAASRLITAKRWLQPVRRVSLGGLRAAADVKKKIRLTGTPPSSLPWPRTSVMSRH